MTKGHFEATKHSYRQSRDGIVISFLVNPADPHDEIAKAALGTRFMVAFSEIGVDGPASAAPVVQQPAQKLPKDRKPFSTLQLSAQAGIRAGDVEFQRFMRSIYTEIPFDADTDRYAKAIRTACAVESRSEFNTDTLAAMRWQELDRQFQAWLTDQRYADLRTS